MARDQLGGDAEQPRASVIGHGSVGAAAAEGPGEHLSGKVIGHAVSDASS
jgi:hypothetical protein